MEDIEHIIKNREIFHKMIYTPLSEALIELKKRKEDKTLSEKINNILDFNIPEPLRNNLNNAVMFRQVATPNYEMRSFIDICSIFELNPIFFEYGDDKFTSNNSYKHSLGQLRLHKNIPNKNGENIEEKVTIVDFNKYNGKKLKEVSTQNNQSLINFHHKLFNHYNYHFNDNIFFEASDWFKKNGGKAIDYYTNFLLLFIYHGVLFENFLLGENEGEFTKNVLIPAFIKVSKLTGLKPLIIPIPPMDLDVEEDFHWHSHDIKIKSFISNN